GLRLENEPANGASSRLIELKERESSFTFAGIDHLPVPSLLRGFSAPVRLEFPYADDDLAFLMMHDTDPFNRWDAGQRLVMKSLVALSSESAEALDGRIVEAMKKILDDDSDPAFRSLMLTLPSESEIAEEIDSFNPVSIHRGRKSARTSISAALKEDFLKIYDRPAADAGSRALRNICLGYLMETPDQAVITVCSEQFAKSGNMTESIAALQALAGCDCAERSFSLEAFFERWKKDALVLDKWFAIQATSPRPATLESVKALVAHKAFDEKNPNKVRALIGAFAHSNPLHFHTREGYEFVREWVLRIDRLNPQVAARLVTAFSRWKRVEPERREMMKANLEAMLDAPGLSKDTFEIVSKSLS
ncbi:MAG TPA: DUF3458 domain-containing protein, partial [Burkholderiales bacterium]|nr:DUF3458 domain-containing protein [Burkholderiales bacterium]